MSEFGETLARYRNEAGLSQRKIGAAIGLDSTQVNKVERGHRPPLGAKYMKPLVCALRLNKSQATNLVVDLAGHSPKVLDFMDGVADGQEMGRRSSRVQPALAVAGSLGAGVGLDAILRIGQQQPDTATQQSDQNIGLLVEQAMAEAQLTPGKRILAERLILENARSVCEVLAKE